MDEKKVTDDAAEMRKSLELLWGAEPRARRGPKPRVTSEQVITAAIAIADADGLDTVSMRTVAERLGLTAMSLYAYVPSKGVLVDAMLDRILGERASAPAADEHWRDGLHRLAHDTWNIYSRHPWALQATMSRRPFGPNILAGLEATLRTVADLGLAPQEMVSIVNTVDDYVHGALAASLETAQAQQASGLSNDAWLERHGPLLAEFATLSDYPTLVELWSNDTLTERHIDFEFGLARVLDGIEGYIATRPAQT
ncbi:MAG TPA: TetR/AcrR family transcriptional regulator [Beutenbergiaceae bacterium]|nr:TetR/AcrR family transcriptional regulator [Beutenbergiaceae bacterium]